MAFKTTLTHRLRNISKISHQTLTGCRISSSAVFRRPPNPEKSVIDPGEDSIFRRFIHRRPLYQSAASSPGFRSMPTGEGLMEKLRGMDIVRDRIRLDGLSPPATVTEEAREGELTVENARKLLKVTQLEMVKSRLRQVEKSCVSYKEFIEICVEGALGKEQGLEFAKMLDESGTVIVLGNVVLLRPDQVVKAIRGLMPLPVAHPDDPRRKELEELEWQKSIIDKKAESMVRRELWCGLGYLVVQTAGFMRLTFWELTWDVMEPICFYVTSIYFMAGYSFFLRTAKEPSFEGFFQNRFSTKQKKLMKANNFDLRRYNELREACYPHSWPREKSFAPDDKSESMEKAPLREYYNLR